MGSKTKSAPVIMRRIGAACEYYEMSDGTWRVHNPQMGLVAVDQRTSRGLALALVEVAQ